MREYWGSRIGDWGLADWLRRVTSALLVTRSVSEGAMKLSVLHRLRSLRTSNARSLHITASAVAFCLLLVGCSGDEADSSTSTTSAATTDSTATTDNVDNGGDASADTSTSTGGESTTDAANDAASTLMIEQPTESAETQRARELFATMLNPTSAEEWDAARLELEGLGQAVTPVLIEALQSDDQIEREMAAQELVLLGVDVSQHHAELLDALDDPSEQVRGNCALALLMQSPESAERALAVLIDVLDTPDPSLREMAALNLKNFNEVVVAQLPQVLAALEIASAEVAVPLIESLAVAGPSAADATDTLQALAAGDDAEIAAAARAALDAINPPAE